MENKRNCLSPTTEALLTILIAAGLLLCIASNNMLFALILVVAMTALKRQAVKCYDKKIDKFYFYAYLLSSVVLTILLTLQHH